MRTLLKLRMPHYGEFYFKVVKITWTVEFVESPIINTDKMSESLEKGMNKQKAQKNTF